MILFKVALGGAIVWILDRIVRKRIPSSLTRALTLVWAMAILSPGFNIRPQIFTYLVFALFLYLFYLFEEKREKALYGIPPLMVLWINLHGGFAAGLGALGLFSLWGIIHGLKSKTPVKHAILPLALALCALLVNPYGLDMLKFLGTDLLLDRPITEWEPISLLDLSFLDFKLALLVGLLGAGMRTAWRRWDFWLAAFAALFALRHQRHTPLFAIAAAPYLAAVLEPACRWMRQRARPSILALLFFAVLFYQLHHLGKIQLEHGLQLVVSPLEYPTQAADFLARNRIGGNLAVPFDWGEYFIWKLYPAVRVSIDGRYTTAYPMQVIQDNFEWAGGGKGWRRLLELYPTEIAITKRDHPVTALMRRSPEWVYIYSDPVAFIFVRKVPAQEELLKRFAEKRLSPPQPASLYFPG